MSGRRTSRGNAGFTLIEVTLGLAILILIFGVIFQLVQMSVLGADAAGKNSQRTREVSGLFALLRQICLDLPIRSQLSLEPRVGGRGYDLVFVQAPLAILPEQPGGQRKLRFLVEKNQESGGRTLVMQEIFQAAPRPGVLTVPETNSFPLMQDLVSLEWRVGNPLNREKPESTDWNDPVKPAYLKIVLVRRQGGGDQTNTGIFWIPTGYSPNGQRPSDPVTRGPAVQTNPATPAS